MNKPLIFGLVALVLIGGAVFMIQKSNAPTSDAPQQVVTETSQSTTTDRVDTDTPTSAPEPVYLTSTLDGKQWNAKAAYQGALFYTKGIEFLKISEPYLQLAFPAMEGPDARQLTISIKGFEPKVGKYAGSMEVLMSGSPTGGSSDTVMQGYQDDIPEQKTNFTFEITKWEAKGEGQAIMSAKFGGDLKGVLGSKPTTFTDGIITDLPVTIYNKAN